MPAAPEIMDQAEAPLDLSKMKKKSKKAAPAFMADEAPPPAADGENGAAAPPEEAGGMVDLKNIKKKKKKLDINLDDLGAVEPIATPAEEEGKVPDLTYDQLLERAFNIMREKNPNQGEKKQFVIRPPEVVKAGAKKTSFVNFLEISKAMNRDPKHVLSFILAELGTSGSIDGNNTLILKGKFQVKQMENILRRYIKEYVMCHTCKSKETKLVKSDRLYFLQCEVCQSRCTVANIRVGFQAMTSKRAAVRAKEV